MAKSPKRQHGGRRRGSGRKVQIPDSTSCRVNLSRRHVQYLYSLQAPSLADALRQVIEQAMTSGDGDR